MKKLTAVNVPSIGQTPGKKRRICSKCKAKRYIENLRISECGNCYVCLRSRGYFSSLKVCR